MGVGSGNMEGALSEGAFMMGMERNSDLVTMTSYAPLMENTKCRMGVNLILVRNDDVIGRSSYWVERMFTDNRPDVNLATDTQLGVLPDKTTPVGGIGLGTYQTAAEYSNIRISVDGEQVYASDPENNPGEWIAASGNWKIEGGKPDPARRERHRLDHAPRPMARRRQVEDRIRGIRRQKAWAAKRGSSSSSAPKIRRTATA